MKARSASALALALLLAALASSPALAQGTGKFFLHPQGKVYFPLDTYSNSISGASESLYSAVGFEAGLNLDYSLTSWLLPFLQAGYSYIPYSGSSGTALQGAEGQLGLGFVFRPMDRLALRLDAAGGLAELFIASKDTGTAFAASARLGLEYRVAPALSLSLSGGYATYFGTVAQIFSAIEAGLYLSYDLSAVGGAKAKVRVEDPKLDAVFPSLYAYYDDNAFGTVKVVNGEDSGITGVSVSFNAGHYMDQPKVCGEYSSIAKGASVTVPVKALFTDSVLQITQGTDAKGEIIVKYDVLGSERSVRVPIDFRMHHRNAITWSDDKRAAAFVSVTNPAALWFSKFASGVVRERMRGDINQPLQYAIGMFEAERLYGLNYVVVPANDYSVTHGLKDYVDSVQFPHQTLSNRGGDCSDLAVLFAALMQSVGVDTAFITIPGHIFAAFDTGLTEAQAQASFYDTGLLIYQGGKAWVPVEITMVKDGFIKAWRVAAKEWYDSVKKGAAAFYTLPDCWKTYPPAAFPGVNPRFTLPSESDESVAFDAALDRFVAREIEPSLKALESDLAAAPKEVLENEVGVLYANYGMLKESWTKLSASAKAGCQQAWTNLANVAYLRKDYKLALSYYQWAYSLNAEDDNALLGMARCHYELEDFNSADAAYALLSERNPKLASRFGYLGSIFGGQGRAWSLADRAATTAWLSARGASSSVSFIMPSTAAPKKQAAVVEPAPMKEAAQTPAASTAKIAAASVTTTRSEAKSDIFVEKPTVAAEAPADPNAIASPAEAAAQARTAALDAQVSVKPAAAPTAPPKVAADIPKDQDLAAKAASDAAAKAAADATAKAAADAAAKAAADAEKNRQAEIAAKEAAAKAEAEQKRKADLAAKAAALLAASSKAVAPPTLTTEAPKDQDIAAKATEEKRVKQASETPEAKSAREAAEAAAAAAAKKADDDKRAREAAAALAAQEAEAKRAAEAAVVATPVKTAPVAPAAVVAPVAVAAPVAPVQIAAAPIAATPVAAPEPKPLGDSDIPATIATEILLSGFEGATPMVGTWSIAGDVASQTDPEAFYAKFGSPLVQDKRALKYSFTAKSTAPGRGWVGIGFHAYVPKSYTTKGYGAGDSICVWLTRDPVHYKENITRLQIYRSVDDWDMNLLAEIPVNESIYDANGFELDIDPSSGLITVSLNGSQRLEVKDAINLHKGICVAFRALDTAQFSAFKVETLK